MQSKRLSVAIRDTNIAQISTRPLNVLGLIYLVVFMNHLGLTKCHAKWEKFINENVISISNHAYLAVKPLL